MTALKRPVLHLHIPKTGGQTFGQRIAKLLPPAQSWYDRGALKAENGPAVLDNAIANDIAFISGHISGGPLFEYESRFDFLSFARNPVDQIISHLAHISREPESPLHPLTQRLSPIEVIEAAPEWFFNMQARYIVTAFIGRSNAELLLDQSRWLLSNLAVAVDRLEWLAPTENLDEFSRIFIAETGLRHPPALASRNRNPDPVDDRWAETRQWLYQSSHRYAVDLALYNEAVRRFEAYRSQYWRTSLLGNQRFADISQSAFTMNLPPKGTIVLGSGWVFRDHTSDGMSVFQAGPTTDSYLEISEISGRYMTFDIVFVAGITVEEIDFFDAATGLQLKAAIVERGDKRKVFVELPRNVRQLSILVRSARAIPLCVYNDDWTGGRAPVPFAASAWSIEDSIQ